MTDEMLDAFCRRRAMIGSRPWSGKTVGGFVDTLTVNVPVEESHDEALAELVWNLRDSQGEKAQSPRSGGPLRARPGSLPLRSRQGRAGGRPQGDATTLTSAICAEERLLESKREAVRMTSPIAGTDPHSRRPRELFNVLTPPDALRRLLELPAAPGADGANRHGRCARPRAWPRTSVSPADLPTFRAPRWTASPSARPTPSAPARGCRPT